MGGRPVIITTCVRCSKLIRLAGPNWNADDGSTRCPGEGNEYEFHIPRMKYLILEEVWKAMVAADAEFRNTATKKDYIQFISEFVVQREGHP
jgi:hypothetical protein